MMVRQNKWRACRYGLDAELVDDFTAELKPVRKLTEHFADLLEPTAEQLDCARYLQHLRTMAQGISWSQRQLDYYAETGDLAEVVRRLTDDSRISLPTE